MIPEVCGTLSDGAHYGGGLNGQDAYSGRIIPAVVGALTAKGPEAMGAPEVDAQHYLPITFGAQMSTPRTDVDMAQTLQAKNPMAVAQPVAVDFRHTDLTGDAVHTLQAKKTGGYSLNYQPGVMQAMQVRRLTPVECERLQGFPDGYTAIPWRNKPADQCPDGPRYKALGNSMAVPVIKWLGERIQMVNDLLEKP